MTYRLSIEERIVLTSGLRPSEKQVLQALARFADFTTGLNARPSVEKLVAWSELSARTVARVLAQLEADGWIEATARRHRCPTVYRICLEQLATSATKAKVVMSDHNFDCQNGSQNYESLTAKMTGLTAKLATLDCQNGSPPRLSTPSQYPSAPTLARRDADTPEHDDEDVSFPTGESPTDVPIESSAPEPDLRADGGHPPGRDPDRPDGMRGGPDGPGEAATSGPRVPLRPRSDPSGVHGPGIREPEQLTFGPRDVTERLDNRAHTIQILREALAQKVGPQKRQRRA